MHVPHASTAAPIRRHARATSEVLATIVALAFLLVGIAGFIPGITENLDEIEIAGTDSQAELLGIFQVSVLHNLVHVAFGLIGLWAARRIASAQTFLIAGGVIYLVLWLYGLVTANDGDANFVPVNTADDWLHFGLGLGMIALGLIGRAADRDRHAAHGMPSHIS